MVVDPVDGSMNAKRGLPFACVSIAVASGDRMGDVEVGFVAELVPARDWWAVRGEGAFCDGERLVPLEPGPLELLGLGKPHVRLPLVEVNEATTQQLETALKGMELL